MGYALPLCYDMLAKKATATPWNLYSQPKCADRARLFPRFFCHLGYEYSPYFSIISEMAEKIKRKPENSFLFCPALHLALSCFPKAARMVFPPISSQKRQLFKK